MNTIDYDFSILVVDDEDHARLSNQLMLTRLLEPFEDSKVNIKLAETIEEMFDHLRSELFHLVLIDRDLGKDSENRMIDGVNEIPRILEIQPTSKVIMVTGHDDPTLAVKAVKNGAMDFIVKGTEPHRREYKNKQILKALNDSRLEIRNLRRSVESDISTNGYICKSPAMKQVENQLNALAYAPTPVLILGETGLGKTHAAKRLNEISKKVHNQKKRVFVNINVNSIPEKLIESEFFGHEKGSFTGATERKLGLFEKAAGGDLFLDEIGDASLQTQVKLLKVIDELTFKRVGGTEEIPSKVRLIFATNKNLEKMVEEGAFRKDFYARIAGITIEMPNLEKRKEDIPYICQNITDKLSDQGVRKISYKDFPLPLQKYFVRNRFPFNIRGIRSDLERLLIYCSTKMNGQLDYSSWRSILSTSVKLEKPNLKSQDLDEAIEQIVDKVGTSDWPGFKRVEEMLEQRLCKRLLDEVETNKERAELLGISESNASTKMKKYKKVLQMELKL